MFPAALLSRRSTLASDSAFSPISRLLSIISLICSRNDAECCAESFILSVMALRMSLMASLRGWVMWPIFSLFCSFSLRAFCSMMAVAALASCSRAVRSCSANCSSRRFASPAACSRSISISRARASALEASVLFSVSKVSARSESCFNWPFLIVSSVAVRSCSIVRPVISRSFADTLPRIITYVAAMPAAIATNAVSIVIITFNLVICLYTRCRRIRHPHLWLSRSMSGQGLPSSGRTLSPHPSS